MSWYDYIPGVANVAAGFRGDWKNAVDPFQAYENIGGSIKDAYDAPFDKKREGYDAVMDRAGELKQERLARKDKTYQMADEKMRPAREALRAVYGDPSTWSL